MEVIAPGFIERQKSRARTSERLEQKRGSSERRRHKEMETHSLLMDWED